MFSNITEKFDFFHKYGSLYRFSLHIVRFSFTTIAMTGQNESSTFDTLKKKRGQVVTLSGLADHTVSVVII